MSNSKWRNYGLWVSLASMIPLVAQATGLFKVPDNYNELVNSILTFLLGAGIISNPSIGNGFMDATKTQEVE